MNDNPSSGNPSTTSNAKQLDTLLPYFKEGNGTPTVFSAADMNRLVRLLRAFRSLKINCQPATANNDGTFNPAAKIKWGDENLIIDLLFPPNDGGGGSTVNIIACRVVSESSEYVTCQPVTATADDTYTDTSDPQINVAKPPELRGLTGTQIQPIYFVSSPPNIIWALQAPTGGTGVFIGSPAADVGYLDLNIGSRIPKPKILTWQGVYSHTAVYSELDIVLVNSGSSQGIWLRVLTGSGSGTDPVFPQPSTTGGTDTWQLWTFGLQATTVCSSGTKTQYLNASPPM